jgi:Outer membrane protein beta-barrel domain
MDRRVQRVALCAVLIGALSGSTFAQDSEKASFFDSARFLRAAQTAQAQPAVSDHQFGVGARLGGSNFGIGATLRYFLDGPLGVQVDVSTSSIDTSPGFDDDNFSSVQIAPSVLYRLRSYEFSAPLTLQPYVGGGLSIIRTNFPDFFDANDDSDTSLGVLVTGGVELFFEKAPKFGVSGAFEYASNSDLSNVSIAGPAFVVAGHYYFR